ncbi:E3 ubiquitin-protein ligase TRIM38, partial [Galemys pyrenaicus]
FKTCGGIKIQVLCISITVENSVNILSDNIGDFQKAMASAPPTKKMMEEATCSVCLQLMREPVSIDCGHIFCRLCIESILENLQVTSLPSRSQCPLCRTPFQRESFRPSKQLQNLIETIKEMERERLCEEHREQLHLFCEDDGQLICWRCERSSQHRGHNTAPVEDVCPGYKAKLHKAVTKLREQEDQCQRLKLTTKEQISKWEEKIKLQREKIQSDFKNLHNLLDVEEKYYLWKLEKEEEQTMKSLQDSEASLEKQSQELKSHILELEKKCQQSAQDLLQDVKDTLSGTLAVKLKEPEAVSLELQTMCNVSELYLDMKKILKTYQVSVTLDVDTAHINLNVSKDRRQVTFGEAQVKFSTSGRFSDLSCVLGCESFTSGRYYFEVDVGEGTQWGLGVCLENVCRSPDKNLMFQSQVWAIKRCKENKYVALTSPPTSLSLSEKPLVVGVFLDCEAGLVSFYNMPTGSHIFTFPKASFSETLRPFFQVYPCSPLFLPPPEEVVSKEAGRRKREDPQRLRDSEASLEKQSQKLKRRILELEKKCQQSAQDLLQNMKDTVDRNRGTLSFICPLKMSLSSADSGSLAVKLEIPEAMSLELQTVFNVCELHLDLKKISKSYQGLQKISRSVEGQKPRLLVCPSLWKILSTSSLPLNLILELFKKGHGLSYCYQEDEGGSHCVEGILENVQVNSSLSRSQCPLCRAPFQRESLRSNKQLENLVETVKEIDSEKLCETHGEQLHLFCEDDGQLICWRCERASQHRGHNTELVEDVCPGYKEKVGLQKQKIHFDFKKLYRFLCEEEKAFLWRLEKEREQTLRILQGDEDSLEQQGLELKSHILELEKKCQQSAQDLLQDVKDTLSRSSAVKLELPEDVSLEIHTVCNVSGLYLNVKKMLKCYQVSVTLDPDTAHEELAVSENRRQVTTGGLQMKPNTSGRFLASPCVLGCEGFTSGRYYFEVDVGEGTGCDLGVCLQNVSRGLLVSLNPESGFWVIRISKTYGYIALTSPPTSLPLSEQPRVVGVFLDCEAGLVSFYDMSTDSHIFTFPKASFSDTLRPFFRVYQHSPVFLPPPDE